MALQNDWIVAGINNPDFTVSDFANFADLTTENTQLLGVDDYIKTDFIQNHPYFRDDAGNFNEDLFRNYYAARAQEFDTFAQDEFYRGPALDMFDLDRTQETPVKDIGFNITRGFNPDRQAIGVEGVNVWSDPKFSQREIAKQNRVFNTERGEFEDWSVDDHTLVSNVKEWFLDLWRDPLVFATWDDDGVHVDPMTGLPQEHVKGQPKLNEKGTYYYETLGDRSVIGKDVLSLFDTLTVDGEGLNKYDFFDSNDLRKSVGGTIAQNVVALLPLFVPGVSSVYSGVLLARELSKTLPMLSGMVTSLTGGETPQWADKASAWAQRMTSSTDDWSREHPFAAGHFISLVTDLAMLTGQQQFIARGLGALKGSGRYMEEAFENAKRLYASKAYRYGAGDDVWRACLSRFMPQAEKMAVRSGQLGRDLGLAYIALTFQHSTYEEMIQRGATKQEASAVALGAMLGMFSVDKWLHLGEIFYNDATGSTVNAARRVVREEIGKLIGEKAEVGDMLARNAGKELGILRSIRSARDWATRTLSEHADAFRYHSLSVTGKMLGSGVERVAETLVADLSKGLYELAGQFGAPTTIKDAGAFEDMTSRYGMAFLAGVVGSGVHYATELVKGTISVPKQNESLATLVRNGYGDELRRQLDRYERSGRTGSRTLSGLNPIWGDDGKVVGWKTAGKGDMSQSRVVAEAIRSQIAAVEASIRGNEVGLTDEEAFENAVFGERRLAAYEKLSGLTSFYDRLAEAYADLDVAEQRLSAAKETADGKAETVGGDGETVPEAPAKDSEMPRRKGDEGYGERMRNIAELEERRAEALARVRSLLGGPAALDYARQIGFMIDTAVSEKFLGEGVDRNSPSKDDYDNAWESFKSLEGDAWKVVREMEGSAKEYAEWGAGIKGALEAIRERGPRLSDQMIDIDTRFDDETDEAYEYRAKRRDGETEKAFADRLAARRARVEEYNKNMEGILMESLRLQLNRVDWKVDPMLKREILTFVEGYGRPKDIIRRLASESGASDVVKGEVSRLEADFSNADEVVKAVSAKVRTKVAQDELSEIARHYRELGRPIYDATQLDNFFKGKTDLSTYLINRNVGDMTAAELFDRMNYEESMREAGEEVKDPVFADLTEESRKQVFKALESFVRGGGYGKEVTGTEPLASEISVEPDIEKIAERFGAVAERKAGERAAVEEQNARNLIDSIRKDELLGFIGRIRDEVRNPVEGLLNRIAEVRGVDVGEGVMKILRDIWSGYDTLDSVASFSIDATTADRLGQVQDLARMLDAFVEVASHKPGPENPVGHNRFINEFMDRNAERAGVSWDRLPELPDDVAMMYRMELNRTVREIDRLLALSDEMLTNKKTQIEDMDVAVERMGVRALARPRGDMKPEEIECELDGYKFRPFEGIGKVRTEGLTTMKDALQSKYSGESVLYGNVERAGMEKGLSVPDVWCESKMWNELLSKEEKDGLAYQEQVSLRAGMGDEMTPYARILYYATVLSERPSKYYSELKGRIEETDFVPIAGQEFDVRMARALFKGNLSRMLKAVYDDLGDTGKEMMERTIIAVGAAGVGKTTAVMGAIVDLLKGKRVFLAGPTDTIARNLARNVGLEVSDTVEVMDTKTLLGKFVEAEDLKAIYGELEADPDREREEGRLKEREYETDHFIRTIDGRTGRYVVHLKEGSVKYREFKEGEAPFAILYDEATNLDSVESLVLNEAMKRVGAWGVYAGDFTQITKTRPVGMPSIEESSVFAIRTPELTLSIRSNNVQKFRNGLAMKGLIDMMRRDSLNPEVSDSEYASNYTIYANLMKRLGLSYYYDGSDINGMMLTDSIDGKMVAMLAELSRGKHADGSAVTVGYIGQPGTSTEEALKTGGVNFESVRFENMNGREYDYVVVDDDLGEDGAKIRGERSDSSTLLNVMRRIYTLDTRSVEGSIVLDRGWSDLVGKTVKSERKAESPSLDDVIGKMKKAKIDALNALDLSDAGKPEYEPERNDAGLNPENPENPENPATPENPAAPENGGTPESQAGAGGLENPADGSDGGQAVDASAEVPVDMDTVDIFDDADKRAESDMRERTVTDFIGEVSGFESGAAGDVGNPADPAVVADGIMRATADRRPAAEGVPADVAGLMGMYDFASYSFGMTGAEDIGPRAGHRAPVWRISPPKEGTLRNWQCLVDGATEVVGYSEKMELQNKCNSIRAAALLGKTFEQLPAWMTRGEGAIVTEEDWNNRAVALEFRAADPREARPLHQLILRRGEDGKWLPQERGMRPSFADRNFYANYVLLFRGGGKGGRKRMFSFDLCGLNNPDTLAANRDRLVESYARAAEKAGDGETKGRMRRYSESVVKASESYSRWFRDMYGAFSDVNGNNFRPMTFDVTDEAELDMRLWFERTEDSIRLGGSRDLDLIDSAYDRDPDNPPENTNSFLFRHPELKCSRVIIIQGGFIEKAGLSPSVKNRAAVVVSADPDEREDELLEGYIKQRRRYMSLKEGETPDPPKYRLMMLENSGLTLREYFDVGDQETGRPGLAEKVDPEGAARGKVRKPVNQTQMGLEMFLSLWNARADITEFRRRLGVWRNHPSRRWNMDQLRELTEVADKIDTLSDRTVEERFNKVGLSTERVDTERRFRAIEDLWRFNNTEKWGDGADERGLKDLPMFRLGGYHGDRGYGFHVQHSQHVSGSMYSRGEGNMIYITEGAAKRFGEMLDAFLDPLTDEGRGLFGLVDEKTGMPREKTQRIERKRAGDRRAVKSLIARVLRKGGTGKVDGVQYVNHQYYSIMAKMVRRVAMKAYRIYRKGLSSGEMAVSEVPYTIKDEAGNDVSGTVEFKLDGMSPKDGQEGGTFMDMLTILFHGTMENPRRSFGPEQMDDRTSEEVLRNRKRSRKRIEKVTGVRFPNGFDIQPGIDQKNKVEIPYMSADGKETLMSLVESDTHPAYFNVRVVPHWPSIRMRGDRLVMIRPADARSAEEIVAAREAKAAERKRAAGLGPAVTPEDGAAAARADVHAAELGPVLETIGKMSGAANYDDKVALWIEAASALRAIYGEGWRKSAPKQVVSEMKSMLDKAKKSGRNVDEVTDPALVGAERDMAELSGGYDIVREVEDPSLGQGRAVVEAAYRLLKGGEQSGRVRLSVRRGPAAPEAQATPEASASRETPAGGAASLDTMVMPGGGTVGEAVRRLLSDTSRDGFLGEFGVASYAAEVAKALETDPNHEPGVGKGAEQNFVNDLYRLLRADGAGVSELAQRMVAEGAGDETYREMMAYLYDTEKELYHQLFEACIGV